MRRLRAFFVRAASVFDRGRADRELQDELAAHLEMEIEENLRRGLPPDEARRTALVKAGGLEQAREACRDRRALPFVDAAIRDLTHALRLLSRSRGFTAVAVLSLALGIGANTAIFSLLDQLVLRRLPVRDPEQLQMIWTSGPHFGTNQGSRASSYPMYQDFQQRASAFSYVFCRYLTPVSVTAGSEPERVMGELVSGNYFQALGVGPAVGRVFSPGEDDRVYKGHPVVVLSHQYWVSRFDADPQVVGRKILVNNFPMVIVGVSAARFSGIDPALSPQLRIPIQMKPLMTPASDGLADRRRQWVQVFARRKPGYTLESAQASLQPLLASILRSEVESPALRELPRELRDRFLSRQLQTESAATGYSDLRRRYSTGLVAVMGMVALVLLIACFNVAGLLVARASAREKEFVLRLALGASRGDLSRQLLIESGVLAAGGSVVGLLLSVVIVRALLGFLPANGMLATLHVQPDWRILGFTAVLALATVWLFGIAPARHAARTDLVSAIKQDRGAPADGLRGARVRRGLVGAQVALSFVLIAGAVLFVRTLRNLRDATSGFGRIDSIVTFQVDPARSGYSLPAVKAFYERALHEVRALPGVEGAAYSWVNVLSGRTADWRLRIEGRPPDDSYTNAYVNGASPGYWSTMGVPLLQGRDFTDRDVDGAPKVAIVNRAFANRCFGGAAIGRHLSTVMDSRHPLDVEIVGVVEDSLHGGPRDGVRDQVFFPYPQLNQPLGVAFYVRTSGHPSGLMPLLRRKVQELDGTVPLFEMKTVRTQLDETLGTERLTATLSVAYGGLATLLAAVGLYGLVSLTVARRTCEIGLRTALGAPRGSVVWMVMKEALGLLLVGVVLGIPAAYGLGRLVSSQLFGVTPGGAGTAAAAAALLTAVAFAAAFVPARRASTIDPMRALHRE